MEQLYSIREVSDRLGGIPLGTLYNWRSRGIGPRAIKVGRHLRFREADVAEWLQEQTDEARLTARLRKGA